jgi:hypothetical protein
MLIGVVFCSLVALALIILCGRETVLSAPMQAR